MTSEGVERLNDPTASVARSWRGIEGSVDSRMDPVPPTRAEGAIHRTRHRSTNSARIRAGSPRAVIEDASELHEQVPLGWDLKG